MTITRNMVVRELERLPRHKKNVANPTGSCAYTSPTGEHCIGGQVLKQLGVNIPKYDEPCNTGHGIEALVQRQHIDMEHSAIQLLGNAQFHADRAAGLADQWTWGEVVDLVLERPAAVEASKRRHPSNVGHAVMPADFFFNPFLKAPTEPKKIGLADFLQANPIGFDQVYTPKAPTEPKSIPFPNKNDFWFIDDKAYKVASPSNPAWIDTTTYSKTKTALLEPVTPKTFSTKELEQYAGVPEPTLRRWRDQGIIDNIHYPPTVQWSEGEARIARVLSRLPALSPALYLKVAHWLRVGTKNWFDMFLTIIGEDVRLVSGVALASYCRATAGRAVTVLPLEQL